MPAPRETPARASPAIVTAGDLLARVIPAAPFVVGDVVPQGLTVLAGRPKLGKSWLTLNVALAVAGGRPVLGRETGGPGSVLVLALEDGDRRLQSRLRLMLGAEPAPAGLSFATTWPALDEGGADALRRWADTATDPRMVIVDVLQRIRPKSKSGHLYADDYSSVLPLKSIADDVGLSVICVTHVGKREASDDPFDAISATTGLIGACDHGLILDRNGTGVHLYGRGRDAPEIDLALRFDPACGSWSALGDADAVTRSDARNSILRALRDAGGAPMTPIEVAERAGITHDVAKKRLPAMAKAGEVEKFGPGSYVAVAA